MVEDSNSLELEELREAARISNIYHSAVRRFRKNKQLTDVVHALLHLSESGSALAVELFHHIHHALNRILREDDADIPELPEERHLIFFAIPICVSASLILFFMWIFFKQFKKKYEFAISGCVIGIIFMLLSGIFSMRHAEIHINLNEVSDAELLLHPIFIHNFVNCILSILSLTIYLIHFWILYDCIIWRRKHAVVGSTRASAESSQSPRQSPRHSLGQDEVPHQLTPIPTWDGLHQTYPAPKIQNVQDEPVILYCCCLDLWNYLMHEKSQRKPNHEFQVVHVM